MVARKPVEPVEAPPPEPERQWPKGAIPYHVDGVRVTRQEWLERHQREAKQAAAAVIESHIEAILDPDPNQTTAPAEPETKE